jgi:hypothetical protein
MGRILLFVALCLVCQLGRGSTDLEKAPPAFSEKGAFIVPVDFQKMDIEYTFDVANQTATGVATIEFYSKLRGQPMMDLIGTPTAIVFNGKPLEASALQEIDDPSKVAKIRVLRAIAGADSKNTLQVSYVLPADKVTFSSTGVGFGTFMSDLDYPSQRGFLERYAPSNFEFDQFKATMTLKVLGGSNDHRLFANGTLEELGRHHWKVTFPDYFTTSSFYLHVTDKKMFAVVDQYQSTHRNIPVFVYAEDVALAAEALGQALKKLYQYETTFGDYAHNALLVYVTPTGGGMEYGGATMTSLGALSHELFHMWFARGVMPANGNAGWIDEALARWNDWNYPLAASLNERPPVNLASFPPYQRATQGFAYTRGGRLMSEIDRQYTKPGGLRLTLAKFYELNKRKTITNEQFLAFVMKESGLALDPAFDRYVYGKSNDEADEIFDEDLLGHTRPYTEDEIRNYR